MKKTVIAGGGREASLRWIGAPDVMETLSKREKASGSGFIWADGKIAGVQAIASARVPAGFLLLADWSTLALCFWAGGLQVDIDASGGFNSLSLSARVVAQVDACFVQPSAVTFANAVT